MSKNTESALHFAIQLGMYAGYVIGTLVGVILLMWVGWFLIGLFVLVPKSMLILALVPLVVAMLWMQWRADREFYQDTLKSKDPIQ